MHIYVIENTLNGDFYIGRTKNSLETRFSQHKGDYKRNYNSKLYNAFHKYGKENFIIYSMEQVPCEELLDEREIYWIKVLEPKYNITRGGTGGHIHDQTGKHWKIKDTSRMKGKKTITDKVIEGRKKLAGGHNYQSIYYIHTPWGTFETWKAAHEAAKALKGKQPVLTDKGSIQKYCLSNIKLNSEGRRTPKEWRGKYTKDLGFFVKEKNE